MTGSRLVLLVIVFVMVELVLAFLLGHNKKWWQVPEQILHLVILEKGQDSVVWFLAKGCFLHFTLFSFSLTLNPFQISHVSIE